ncbi:MAG TPA: DinB family protein [Bryobacteraceae bacterium]|nr:DinB family protein [Bryobacteraceae bacterium]
MTRFVFTSITGLFALALPAFSQSSVKDALVKHWQVTSDFTIAVAKQMPAESYGFRPVPEELSFAQLMVQIAGANVSACGRASGMKPPAIPEKLIKSMRDEKAPVDITKDEAVQFLTDTFKFCNEAVASMTPEKLDAEVGAGTRKMTGFEWLWAYFTHTAHHRGQAEVYLRLKGIVPTAYTF